MHKYIPRYNEWCLVGVFSFQAFPSPSGRKRWPLEYSLKFIYLKSICTELCLKIFFLSVKLRKFSRKKKECISYIFSYSHCRGIMLNYKAQQTYQLRLGLGVFLFKDTNTLKPRKHPEVPQNRLTTRLKAGFPIVFTDFVLEYRPETPAAAWPPPPALPLPPPPLPPPPLFRRVGGGGEASPLWGLQTRPGEAEEGAGGLKRPARGAGGSRRAPAPTALTLSSVSAR